MDLVNLDEDTIDAEILDSLRVIMENSRFSFAASNPSALRKRIVEVPIVNLDDMGGLDKVKQELQKPSNTPGSTMSIEYGM